MDAIGVNRISVPKASFLGVEEGVPRCRRPRSSVPLIRHLGEEKKEGRYRLKINLISIHSQKGMRKVPIVIFFLHSKNALSLSGGGVKVRANIKKCVSAAIFPICRASDIAE